MKVLIIQFKMIGDVLTSSCLFNVIKQQQPDWELHYLIHENTLPVISNHPFIDKVITLSKHTEKDWFKIYKFAQTIRSSDYDAILDIQGQYASNFITLWSGAQIKTGKKKWYTRAIYNRTIIESRTSTMNIGMALENRLKFLETISIKKNAVSPQIYLTSEEKRNAVIFLENNKLVLDKPLIMISLLGSCVEKTYPLDYMAQVLDKIVSTVDDVQLLLNYIPNQINEVNRLYNLCTPATQKHIYNEVYASSLREFIVVSSLCHVVLGNEGGAINMSKAVNTSTFSIFSPWIKKESWALNERENTHTSVHLKDFLPDLFRNKESAQLKANQARLYQLFKPQFFYDKLQLFLNAQRWISKKEH